MSKRTVEQETNTVESLELKKQVSNDMRECLIKSGNFDTDVKPHFIPGDFRRLF